MVFVAPFLRAVDVSAYAVIKQQYFSQTNAATPFALSSNGWAFQAVVFATTNDVVTNATVTPPSAIVKTLAYSDSTTRRYKELFNNSNALETAYPSTTYSVTMKTVHDGTQTKSLSFSSFYTYSTVTPQISNWTSAQQIDSALPFTLQWSALGNSGDIVSLYIGLDDTNGVFYSPDYGAPGALNGTSTSIVIPAYTLPPGTNLVGILLIIHAAVLFPDTSYGTGSPGYAKATIFNLTTRAFLKPTLTLLSRTGTTNILKLSGESNRTYQIESTTNNLFTNWSSLFTTNLTGTTNQFRYTNTSSNVRRLYRGKVGP